MKLFNLKKFHMSQSGFTLIELMVSLLISGIIGLGASVASFQVLNVTTKNNHYDTASRNVMNAMHWITRDAIMAQSVYCSGFPLTSDLSLKWTTWDNVACSVNYTLQNGQLRRIYYDGTQKNQSLVAEYISSDPAKTFCSTDNGTLSFTITSSVGEGNKAVDVSRTREIVSRPNL
jgi:prepilin-type N-terminal cleavage/methylation domain-containing protein